MKTYKKQYEDVFSKARGGNKGFLNLDKISIDGMETDEYISLFGFFLTGFYSELFDNSVKVAWLRRTFCYYGEKGTPKLLWNSPNFATGLQRLTRRIMGRDLQVIIRSVFFAKLETYFDDLFPDFMANNPFHDPDYYKFPFSYISIDHMMVVYHMDDRFALLKIADDEKMPYAVFVDYVINHALSVNDELKREKYVLPFNSHKYSLFYVKDSEKPVRTKRPKGAKKSAKTKRLEEAKKKERAKRK